MSANASALPLVSSIALSNFWIGMTESTELFLQLAQAPPHVSRDLADHLRQATDHQADAGGSQPRWGRSAPKERHR